MLLHQGVPSGIVPTKFQVNTSDLNLAPDRAAVWVDTAEAREASFEKVRTKCLLLKSVDIYARYSFKKRFRGPRGGFGGSKSCPTTTK